MASLVVSSEERHYIVCGINQDFRNDGRACTDYRTILLETGIVSNATGSAHVKVAGTNVLVGVKAEIGEPLPSAPHCGRLEFFVDCSANASPIFEGRGGDDLALELAGALRRMFCTGTLRLDALAPIPGKACWVLYVDALVLECGGNLFDALSVAVKSALFSARIPKLRVIGEGSEKEVEVSEDPYDTAGIDVSKVPLLVTVNKVGDRFVVDATAEEEACSDAQLLVSVSQTGKICSVQKHGHGGINPELMFEMLEVGRQIGKDLNAKLMKTLQRAETSPDAPKMGFLR